MYQELVPAKWHLDLFLRVHCEECRNMEYNKVYDMLWKHFNWYRMSENATEWLASCKKCQWAKAGGRPPFEQDIEGRPIGHLRMGIAGLFRGESGCKYILLVQDYFGCT